MRIAIVGTCQAPGMATVTRRLLPNATVSAAIVAHDDADAYRAAIAGADHVVTQCSPPGDRRGRHLPPEHLFVPPIVFPGFHPDMLPLVVDGAPIDGPIGQYHSRIAIAGFLAGLPPERTAALYNAHVFAELGYFDAYDIAARVLLRRFDLVGLSLGRTLERWRRRGRTFMHTINHPTIALLERVTVLALAKLGLIEARQPRLRGLPDELGESIVGPVFAPIARRIGVSARETYLKPVAWAAPGEGRDVPVAEHVARSYAIYAGHDREALRRNVAEAAAKIAALIA